MNLINYKIISLILIIFINTNSIAEVFKCDHILNPITNAKEAVDSELLTQLKFENQKLFDRTDLSYKDKTKQSFENYLKHRLTRLNPRDKQSVYEFLSGRVEVIIQKKETPAKSHFSFENQIIQIVTTNELAGTVSYYKVLAHEMEHYIQYLTQGGAKRFNPYPTWVPTFYTVHLYQIEKEAMSAEATYLLSIPQKIRELEIENLQLNQNQFQVGLVDSLKADNVNEYLFLQHQSGRYSKKQLLSFQVISTGYPLVFVIGGFHFILKYLYN